MVSLTLQQFPLYYRALLHLGRFDRPYSDHSDRSIPMGLTSDGIADAVGRVRAQVSITIKDMTDRGWITYEPARMIDGRMRKVALLTDLGRNELARATRIAEGLGVPVTELIMAPVMKSSTGRITDLAVKCGILEDQIQDLRRQIDAIAAGGDGN